MGSREIRPIDKNEKFGAVKLVQANKIVGAAQAKLKETGFPDAVGSQLRALLDLAERNKPMKQGRVLGNVEEFIKAANNIAECLIKHETETTRARVGVAESLWNAPLAAKEAAHLDLAFVFARDTSKITSDFLEVLHPMVLEALELLKHVHSSKWAKFKFCAQAKAIEENFRSGSASAKETIDLLDKVRTAMALHRRRQP